MSRWPGYAAGRAAFNEGARIFEDYRKARAWVPGLDRVPDLMETAARAFETAQSAATPEDADRLRKYTDQSYRLAMAARQAVLMHQDDPGATPSTSASARLPSASRPRRPAPRIPPPASPTSERLQLAPSWNSVRPPSSPALRDFRALLRGRGTPGVDPAPAAPIEFMQDVRYLAPSSEVAERLGLGRMIGRSPVHMHAFPADSFTVLNYMVDDHSVFDSVQLVVDALDHVVAIQWIGERPQDHTWLPGELLDATRWNVADFLSGKPKPSSVYRLGHRVRARPGMVQIDTEQTDETGGQSLRRQMLLLPQPIVNLLLLRMG